MNTAAGWYPQPDGDQLFWRSRTGRVAKSRPTPDSTWWPRKNSSIRWGRPVVVADVHHHVEAVSPE